MNAFDFLANATWTRKARDPETTQMKARGHTYRLMSNDEVKEQQLVCV